MNEWMNEIMNRLKPNLLMCRYCVDGSSANDYEWQGRQTFDSSNNNYSAMFLFNFVKLGNIRLSRGDNSTSMQTNKTNGRTNTKISLTNEPTRTDTRGPSDVTRYADLLTLNRCMTLTRDVIARHQSTLRQWRRVHVCAQHEWTFRTAGRTDWAFRDGPRWYL